MKKINQIFSLRKLAIGLVSVLVGTSIYLISGNNSVLADAKSSEQPTEQVIQSTSNKQNKDVADKKSDDKIKIAEGVDQTNAHQDELKQADQNAARLVQTQLDNNKNKIVVDRDHTVTIHRQIQYKEKTANSSKNQNNRTLADDKNQEISIVPYTKSTITPNKPDKPNKPDTPTNSVKITIKFIDDTLKKDLYTTTKPGKPGDAINYSVTDKINNYLNLGYLLISNNYPTDAKFSNKDTIYEIHLAHRTVPVNPYNPGDLTFPSTFLSSFLQLNSKSESNQSKTYYAVVQGNKIIATGLSANQLTQILQAVDSPHIKNYQLVNSQQSTIGSLPISNYKDHDKYMLVTVYYEKTTEEENHQTQTPIINNHHHPDKNENSDNILENLNSDSKPTSDSTPTADVPSEDTKKKTNNHEPVESKTSLNNNHEQKSEKKLTKQAKKIVKVAQTKGSIFNTPKKSVTSSTPLANHTNKKQLPKTGEESTNLLALIGLMLTSLISLFIVKGKRKE